MKHDAASVQDRPDRPHRALGQRIAKQRRAVFLTQAELAQRLDVTQSAVARWESGESEPALRHRARLAQELFISPHILFTVEAVA